MIYDTHSHPYLAKEKSQEEILENFFSNPLNRLNSIACDLESSTTSIEIARKFDWAYASIGIHPTHCLEYFWKVEETIKYLEDMYYSNKHHIVAIGEIWLDYHWLKKLSDGYNISQSEIILSQKEFFIAQIALAKKLELPIIIHNRDSSDEVLEILRETWCKNFVFHCYSEDLAYAQKLLSHSPNCMLWFWWVVTFKNALKTQETASCIPLANIIIETDSPYLTPTPYRGKQENEPSLTRYVLSKIIDLRSESTQEVTSAIYKNSLKFFWVK